MIWHDTLAVPSFQVFYLHVQDDWVGHILDNIRAWLQQAAVAVHYVSSTSALQSRFALLDVWAAFSLSSKNQTCSLSDAGFSIRDNSIISHRLSKFSKMLQNRQRFAFAGRPTETIKVLGSRIMHFFQLAAGESLYVVSKVEFLKNASLFPLPVGSLGALWLYFLLIFCGHPCGQQDHPRPLLFSIIFFESSSRLWLLSVRCGLA